MYKYKCPCYIASIDSLTHISDADDALDARKLCVNLAPGIACPPLTGPTPCFQVQREHLPCQKGQTEMGG